MKKTILVLTNYYLPGNSGGGPIKSIANIVDNLGDDFDFKIITANHDLGSSMRYPGIKHGLWNEVGKAKVFYLPKGLCSYLTFFKLIRNTPHNLQYLNSFFSPKFTIYPLFLRLFGLVNPVPFLLAPRGEFSEGALRIKRTKKYIYILLSKCIKLYKNVFWHASTELEKRDILTTYSDNSNSVFSSPILLASDLVSIDIQANKSRIDASIGNETNTLSICFFSRISPKKNLTFALKVLSQVTIPVYFTIYGPKEDEPYWEECQSLINDMPDNVKVYYGGHVNPVDVSRTLAQHDLMFVPTLGENFGHVFVEAWGSGTPILISDQTPWRGLESQSLGWDIPLDNINAFVNAINQAHSWTSEQRLRIYNACITKAIALSRDFKSIESNHNMFLACINWK